MRKGCEGWKVLVVDNSNSMTLLIKHFLIGIGFDAKNIYLATDGQQALMMLDIREFELITTSIHLKFISVESLIKKIRNHENIKNRNAQLLIISGEKYPSLIDKIQNYGADGYLGKPFLKEELAQAIEGLNQKNGFVCFEQKREKSSKPICTDDQGSVDGKIISAFVESAVESFGQYMIAAEPGDPIENGDVEGDFSSLIDLTDEEHKVRLLIFLYFPKNVACSIYEMIFGEIDLSMICGVVEELGNIIGGIVKVKIADYSNDIFKLVHSNESTQNLNGTGLNFQLGLPKAKMGEVEWNEVSENSGPQFLVPFDVNGEKIQLRVNFQKA